MSQTVSTDLPVNVEATAALTGNAALAIVLAQAARRPHLIDAIQSFVWDRESGLSIIVRDAGERQHLANALGFPAEVHRLILARDYVSARRGTLLDVEVTIWNPRGAS